MSFLHCGKFTLSLARPLIMGVVNVTPDSFSDGELCATTELAVEHARRLAAEGADILDIGGESTRPGAAPVPLELELSRVIPVLEALRDVKLPVSIDTSKPGVMLAAIQTGASMVNDVNALQAPGALEAVASSNVAVCLMHKQGDPQTMQQNPHYENILTEVLDFLSCRVAEAQRAGIERERIVIDPGFGFGKTLAHNLTLLRNLGKFGALAPVLAGLSRKTMLGLITGRDVGDRGYASIAAAILAVAKGAKIVRVHDVKATKDALAVFNAVEWENDE